MKTTPHISSLRTFAVGAASSPASPHMLRVRCGDVRHTRLSHGDRAFFERPPSPAWKEVAVSRLSPIA